MFGFRVGGNANVRFGVKFENFRVFRYQHVGIPNVKFWRWGSRPTQGPNAKVLRRSGIKAANMGLFIDCLGFMVAIGR